MDYEVGMENEEWGIGNEEWGVLYMDPSFTQYQVRSQALKTENCQLKTGN